MASDDIHPRPSEPDAASSPPKNTVGEDSSRGNSRNQPAQTEPERASEQPPPKPFYRRPVLMTVLLILVIASIVGGVGWWLYSSQFEWTDDAFIDGHVVEVAPKVAGYVSKILVDDNQMVDAGELIVEIDPRDYQVALDEAQAAEVSAEGGAAQAKARVDAAIAQAAADESEVTAANATALNAQQDYDRNARLAPRSVSQQSLDSSAATAASTQAQALAAKSRAASSAEQIKLAKSALITAQADVEKAKVKVAEAKLNLSYTKIVAPIRGRVTHRTVELGEYLQPGRAMLALVDPDLWVTANFKETQLTEMRAGQRVVVKVDAFPDRKLDAHVDSFQHGTGASFSAMPPENATGNYVKVVQRVPVKIVFDQPIPSDMVVGPGMSVVPTVSLDGNHETEGAVRTSSQANQREREPTSTPPTERVAWPAGEDSSAHPQ